MKLWPFVVSGALALTTGSEAFADKPTMADLATAVHTLAERVHPDHGEPQDADVKRALELVTAPFTYEVTGFYDDRDVCAKRWKRRGIIGARDLPSFGACFATAFRAVALGPQERNDASSPDWSVADPRHLDRGTAGYKDRIVKLLKDPDRLVVIAHFAEAGPREHWNIYGARSDHGKVKLDTWIQITIDDPVP